MKLIDTGCDVLHSLVWARPFLPESMLHLMYAKKLPAHPSPSLPVLPHLSLRGSFVPEMLHLCPTKQAPLKTQLQKSIFGGLSAFPAWSRFPFPATRVMCSLVFPWSPIAALPGSICRVLSFLGTQGIQLQGQCWGQHMESVDFKVRRVKI